MDTSWKATRTELPPEGLVVETAAPEDPHEFYQTTLIRRGKLWFLPSADGVGYVDYTPQLLALLGARRSG